MLEEALAVALRERVRLSVAGRTDAGVHALAQVASFATGAAVEPERLLLTLNALLPPDVAVRRVARAADGFAARAARARTYRYRLWLPNARPVFEARYVWDVRGPVDHGLLEECARLLVGRRDFAALSPSARLYHTCVRDVTAAAWSLSARRQRGRVRDHRGQLPAHDGARGRGQHGRRGAGAPLAGAVRRGAGGRRALRAMGRTAPARGLALVAVDY